MEPQSFALEQDTTSIQRQHMERHPQLVISTRSGSRIFFRRGCRCCRIAFTHTRNRFRKTSSSKSAMFYQFDTGPQGTDSQMNEVQDFEEHNIRKRIIMA